MPRKYGFNVRDLKIDTPDPRRNVNSCPPAGSCDRFLTQSITVAAVREWHTDIAWSIISTRGLSAGRSAPSAATARGAGGVLDLSERLGLLKPGCRPEYLPSFTERG